MGQFVSITDKPVRVTSASDAQELRIAPEVLEFDELDLTLHVRREDGEQHARAQELQKLSTVRAVEGNGAHRYQPGVHVHHPGRRPALGVRRIAWPTS
jgi:hypothetical protein